jgi:hypothetical protein
MDPTCHLYPPLLSRSRAAGGEATRSLLLPPLRRGCRRGKGMGLLLREPPQQPCSWRRNAILALTTPVPLMAGARFPLQNTVKGTRERENQLKRTGCSPRSSRCGRGASGGTEKMPWTPTAELETERRWGPAQGRATVQELHQTLRENAGMPMKPRAGPRRKQRWRSIRRRCHTGGVEDEDQPADFGCDSPNPVAERLLTVWQLQR